MKVVVNGQKIETHDKLYSVKINSGLIDTIKVDGVYGKYSHIILTKLKEGEKYRITFNPCSGYQIRSKADTVARTRLIRLITTNNDNKPLFFQGTYCSGDLKEQSGKDTSIYFKNAYSGMCPFAVSSFYVCTEDVDLKACNDSAICSEVIIQYFSTEMFSVIYDCKTRQMNVKFDGYYDKTKKILIKEN